VPIRTNRGRAAVYRKLWGWPMRSPRHLVMLVVVLAVLITAIGISVPKLLGPNNPRGVAAATDDTGSSAGPTPTTPGGTDAPSTSTSMPTRLTAPPGTPTTAPPDQAALDVATQWAQKWVNHPDGMTAEQWLEGLRPLTTEEYIGVMATVEPANIPATKVTGPPVAKESYTTSVKATVPTDGGNIDITLISTPQGWRVAFYEQVA
jgi:cell division protein FtsN